MIADQPCCYKRLTVDLQRSTCEALAMDSALLAVGLFALAAILLLEDALRRPDRWLPRDPGRWWRMAVWVLALTGAAIVGAAAAQPWPRSPSAERFRSGSPSACS